MTQQDHSAGEVDKPEIVFGVVFIANNQSAKVVQPGEEALHFPAALEAAQGTSVLSNVIGPATSAVWRNHFSPELLQNLTVQPVTVISLIANESLRNISNEALLQCLSHQFYFSRASTVCAYGDRKTMAVCNCHDLGALSAFSLSHAEPPFLAGAKLPSMNASLRSKPPRSFRSWATASSTCSRILERTQFWKRRCTVWYAPYRLGKSFHGAPVRSIHRIPFRVVRRSLHGRPRRSARTRSGGKMVSTICHCSSVRSISP